MNLPQTPTLPPLRRLGIVLAAATALGLAACGREEPAPTAGQQLDAALAEAGERADEAGERIAEGASELRDSVAGAAAAAGDAIGDAAITAAVKAQLVRDPELSALAIDVETAEGRVTLEGTAPSAAARERAAELARQVDGVVAVDNQLTLSTS